jgi:hypothetical protein
MKLVVSVLLSCMILATTAVIGTQYMGSAPSTALLDQDIAEIDNQIQETEDERKQFGDGAIQNIFQVRLEILKTSRAMLEQKRLSLLRRIDLTYTVAGSSPIPDEERIAALSADRREAVTERDRHRAEADRYIGGLIQSLALMTVATSEMTIAQVDLALLAEKYGFMIDLSSGSQLSSAPIAQTTVNYDEAL